MNRFVVSALTAPALLAAATLARAEDEPWPAEVEERARAAALAWLTEGPHAPRPDLDPERLERAPAERSRGMPAQGGEVVELFVHEPVSGRLAFTIRITQAGTVVGYMASDRDLIVPRWEGREARDPADVATEVEVRSFHDRAALEARARAFLVARYPGFADRSFPTAHHSFDHEQNPVSHYFLLQEEPADGVRAVYPNRVILQLNPETADLTLYIATDVRTAVREAPAVDEARARAIASAARGAAAVERARLTVIVQGGEARPVWLCGFADAAPVLVDAETGELRELRES